MGMRIIVHFYMNVYIRKLKYPAVKYPLYIDRGNIPRVKEKKT